MNVRGGRYGSALRAARTAGYVPIVEMLLHAGALEIADEHETSLNKSDTDNEDYESRLASCRNPLKDIIDPGLLDPKLLRIRISPDDFSRTQHYRGTLPQYPPPRNLVGMLMRP